MYAVTGAEEGSSKRVEVESKEKEEEIPRREPAGTKRKAEVLSKESGKIGVTITTSSPPLKVTKLSSPSPLSPTQVRLNAQIFFIQWYRAYPKVSVILLW